VNRPEASRTSRECYGLLGVPDASVIDFYERWVRGSAGSRESVTALEVTGWFWMVLEDSVWLLFVVSSRGLFLSETTE
jgi:hypothetical protein